jgi:outer membrane lipoprotein SlyB
LTQFKRRVAKYLPNFHQIPDDVRALPILPVAAGAFRFKQWQVCQGFGHGFRMVVVDGLRRASNGGNEPYSRRPLSSEEYMKNRFALLISATFLVNSALAVEATPKARYDAAKKAATSRYAEDKKICADEASSGARMQCLRDAKAEYNKALAAAKSEQASATASVNRACAGCGKVLSVNVVEQDGEGGPMGMVAGGVAGALLGNQVGKGTGRSIATLAGAAGGAYAGHKIEQKVRSVKKWEVAVRFDSGEEKTFAFDQDPGFSAGAAVKANNGSIVPR